MKRVFEIYNGFMFIIMIIIMVIFTLRYILNLDLSRIGKDLISWGYKSLITKYHPFWVENPIQSNAKK